MARTNIALTAEVSGSAIVGLEPNRKDSIRDGRVRVGVSNATSPDTLSHVPAATSEPNRRQLRLMARNVPDKERNKLYKEHAELVWKDVSSGLTSDENCRLNIVKWMLEQIEAAEVGPGLDQLEQVAELIDAQARHLKAYAAENRTKVSGRPFFPDATRKNR